MLQARADLFFVDFYWGSPELPKAKATAMVNPPVAFVPIIFHAHHLQPIGSSFPHV
jgi:hypothetical protein